MYVCVCVCDNNYSIVQAYYGLIIRGKLQAKESVFLTAGTNYTILAALNFLQNSDVTVYVSVLNESQRQYIQNNYPKVRYACDTRFAFEYSLIAFWITFVLFFRFHNKTSSTINLQSKRSSKRPTAKAWIWSTTRANPHQRYCKVSFKLPPKMDAS